MPLFRIKGHAPDNTYLYDFNPDPSKFEEVVDEVEEVKAVEPVATPAKPKATPAKSEESA